MTQDPTHVPHFVHLARVVAAQGRDFMCLGVPTPYCLPFNTPAPAANDE